MKIPNDMYPIKRTGLLFLSLMTACAVPALIAEAINPFPRPVIASELSSDWTFEKNTAGWQSLHLCRFTTDDGSLTVHSEGNDPYFASPQISVQGPALVEIEMKTTVGGNLQLFYASDKTPHFNEKMSAFAGINPDGNWHTYKVSIPTEDTIRQIRLDPGASEGLIQFRSIKLFRQEYHPLEITEVKTSSDVINVTIKNHGRKPRPYHIAQKTGNLDAGQQTTIQVQSTLADRSFVQEDLKLESSGLPPITRPIYLYNPDGQGDFVNLTSGSLTAQVEKNGTFSRFLLDGKLVAVLAPIVHDQGQLPELKLKQSTEKNTLRFDGKGVAVQLQLEEDTVRIAIDSDQLCEGPVVRTIGSLEQGLLSGLEYLGKNERSSTKLDIESDGYLRFEPDIMKVTMPLMACITDKAAAAFLWEDMTNQPTYAVPNFVDGTPDHRMSLKGNRMRVKLLIKKPVPLEETIRWALDQHPLPPLPDRPRTWEKQKELSLACLNGPDRSEKGWGHCVEDHWPRAPFCDQASTVWRLSGRIPEFKNYQLGGAHIPNESIFFVTGNAASWLAQKKTQIASFIHAQQPDGSFRYEGEYRRGHFEDTASGYCAWRAVLMAEYVRLTGDPQVKAATVKTLDYMKRFCTPRGAQTWEVPLHTPDILGSAFLVWSYVRGYEITGDASYLTEARRWALTGVPFVYLWSNKPVMAYSTIAVYGATNWIAPDWMGLPVQWCGLDYAYALLLLEPYDHSVDWRRLAEGILISGQQMQLTSGPNIGALPDSFNLTTQHPNPWMINPCALISIDLCLQGKLDSLSVARDDNHIVVSPFPATIKDAKAYIKAQEGLSYQIVINASKIIDIESKGTDIITLD